MKAKSKVPVRSGKRPGPIKSAKAAPKNKSQIQRIVVTTDFSEDSKQSLPYAGDLAEKLHAELALLTVVEPPPRFAGLESVIIPLGDAAVGEAQGAIDQSAREAFPRRRSLKTHVRTGKPYREIGRAVLDLQADLLVMATHGRSGLRHVLLGSTTERVIQNVRCPVLIVRGPTETPPSKDSALKMNRILCATDFSENATKALLFAQPIITAFRAKLSLVHVVEQFPIDSLIGSDVIEETKTRIMTQAQSALDRYADQLRKEHALTAQVQVRFGIPFDEITQAAREIDADLIVIATHGYSGLKRIYLGSVAERVVRHAHCPVLVVRET